MAGKVDEQLPSGEDYKDVSLQTCLGDAFATYTIGPAYAYAALTLLLNPIAPYGPVLNPTAPGEPAWGSDECRAQAIFCMLEQMNKNKSPDDGQASFLEPRLDLESAWRAAKAQAGVPLQPEQDHIDRVRAIVQALWQALHDQ